MSNYISCHLMGGLGNQLFQIFATISYGMKYKRKVLFQYSDNLFVGITRPTYWNNFLSNLKGFTTYNNSDGISNDRLMLFPRFNENGFHFQEIPHFDEPQLMLFGYFQSYKYFEEYKNTIFSFLKIATQIENVKLSYNQYFDNSKHTISMHFRIGDYKHIQNFHPLMPYEYYKNALEHIVTIRDKNTLYDVLYFCEKQDNEIVDNIIENLIKIYPQINFIKADDIIDDWKQMLLMSSCQDNIIANSTFSWWGAYFNMNSEKIVCYPDKWFGPATNHNVSDLFPTSWKKILFE
uniref:Alpha-1,2-fucosyltransferase n=1 Tax=viral metagenome TaxID=1070528 RepID=A0A6C0DM52_9ZZZZ